MFQAVGGTDVKSLSINIMRRTLTDRVAQSFSFTGKKGYKDEKKKLLQLRRFLKPFRVSGFI